MRHAEHRPIFNILGSIFTILGPIILVGWIFRIFIPWLMRQPALAHICAIKGPIYTVSGAICMIL